MVKHGSPFSTHTLGILFFQSDTCFIRERLKKAARYAGAGLAVSPPFVAKVSLGESSLKEALTRAGVDWKG